MFNARGTHLSSIVVSSAGAGALAAAAAGAIDGLWSWSQLAQFLPDAPGRLRLLVFLVGLYALAGALVGVLGALVATLFWRWTRLGDLVTFGLARHREVRAASPRDALIGLSLVLAGIPCLAGSLGGAYVYAGAALAARKHMGLVIASAMGLAVGAALAAVLASFLLARPVELGLRALARSESWARILSSPRAPVLAAALLVGAAAAAAVVLSWQTLALLGLRPLWILLLAAVLAVPSLRIGWRTDARLATLRAATRRAVLVAAPVLALMLMLTAGASDRVRKAAGQYSGLGGPLARAARTLGDLDRDGASRILGGGDCDDWNAAVHPGAVEIPDDGIDQNCVGGDATLSRSTAELAFVPVPREVPQDLNIVLITIDTLRADHLGAYGYHRPTSPSIDAIAREGALFRNAWAHAPSTRYSIPALLTGRYPLSVHYDRSIQGWPGLSDKNTTIAEILQAAGMTTGAILNYWYFDTQRRMNQGFAHYDNQNSRLHRQLGGEGPAKTQGSSSREQTDKALAFIGRHAGERFFLWVHYYDPHYQYEDHREVPSFGSAPKDLYDGEIRFTDMHIGRLIANLRERGLYERTAIVITGDHGEGFGEHGIDLHGYHLYAAQTKVPLIIRVPGVAPVGADIPAAHVDVLPTLANLVGAAPSPDMMGRSLLDVITGQADASQDRYVFQQLSYENRNEMRAAASKQCHVIYNVSPDTSWELYRVDQDPMEARDIIDSPGPCAGARAVLEAWYDISEIPPGAAEALAKERPPVDNPIDIDFGPVTLIGVDLPAQPVRPGQSVDITYTFAATATLSAKWSGWKIFAHFEGPGGRRFQGDHEPPRPFAWWQEGQYIRYSRSLTVPPGTPPGTYQLWMGIFRKAERKPARSSGVTISDDRANAGAIQVAR